MDCLRIAKTIDDLLERASNDKLATYAERSALVRAALSANRQRAQLNGELGARETTLVASPQFRRFLAVILDELKKFPDAARALEARLEREELVVAA